jgi:hypothetical protein
MKDNIDGIVLRTCPHVSVIRPIVALCQTFMKLDELFEVDVTLVPLSGHKSRILKSCAVINYEIRVLLLIGPFGLYRPHCDATTF